MNSQAVSIFVIADFTIGSFSALLERDTDAPRLKVTEAPYDQVEPSLLALADGNSPAREVVFVWTQPDAVIASFAALLRGEIVDIARVLEEVNAFCEVVARAAARCQSLFIPLWILPAHQRGLGLLDLKLQDQGVWAALLQMNGRLLERLSRTRNVYPLNAPRWAQKVGERSFNSKQWYLGKVPLSNEVYKEAVLDLKAGLSALSGQARKLMVVDLDNTLWGGIVGDTGWEGITLGGHHAAGEAFVDFQRALKGFKRRGILLGIVSKNDESVAMEALTRHPEMVLRPADFVAWRINWGDKAQNLAELVKELNLGLQSTVFIDDSAFERGRIRESLPEVLVPEWPTNPMLYVKTLEGLRCFDVAALTDEDRKRHAMYSTERQRDVSMGQATSPEAWLKTLEMKIKIEPLQPNNISRVIQLLNKTNQMNLKTRRMTADAFQAWCNRQDRFFWAFRVSDRFGDSGLTALLSLERSGARVEIIDFVVSCRVFKRGVEEALVSKAVEQCRRMGVERLVCTYDPTEKNAPCLAFWENSGFDRQGDGHTFVFDSVQPYDPPAHIEISEITSDHSRGL
jgi:FkbH-like protein